MKLLTILLILLQINIFSYGNYNNSYSNHYNSYNSVSVEQTNRRIGYTTNYSNGQFNSTQYYRSTYTPTASNSGGRPRQPRKVKGYDDNGNEINTDGQGNPSDPSKGMWGDGYEYYYESSTGYWYRTKDGGKTWQKWSSWLDWGGLFWDWRGGRPHGGNVTHYNEQNPVPIGDAIVPLLTILLLYIGYDILVKSRLKK